MEVEERWDGGAEGWRKGDMSIVGNGEGSEGGDMVGRGGRGGGVWWD